jgi:hypothetical protein
MRGMGRYFVDFVSQYGYDRMLSVLGRHLRDFLNGEFSDPSLDIHQKTLFIRDGESTTKGEITERPIDNVG